jgi:uncharacterized membrane protein (UPF0127 family)
MEQAGQANSEMQAQAATAIRSEDRDACVRVVNSTRNTEVGSRVEVAASSAKRTKGLLGRKSLDRGEGMWIVPCESVHTFFMRFPLDLIYLDRKHRVKKVRKGVPPWRVSLCLSAHSVLEFPSGTIRDSQTEVGDSVEIVPVAPENNTV